MLLLASTLPEPLRKVKHSSDLDHLRLTLPRFKLHIDGIIQYVPSPFFLHITHIETQSIERVPGS